MYLSANGFTPRKIALLINVPVDDREEFLADIDKPGTVENEAFIKGRAIGDKGAVVELKKIIQNGNTEAEDKVKALQELGIRQLRQKTDDLKNELFGL
jgi:hypothetical protein